MRSVERPRAKRGCGFRILGAGSQNAIAHFAEAATSFNADDDQWVGEAAIAAAQFGAGLDEVDQLDATMQTSVDGSTVDVASAETAADTVT